MIGYVTLGTDDLERARVFYDELFGSIGARRRLQLGGHKLAAFTIAPQD